MAGRVTSPVFVGRRAERARLLGTFQQASDGRPSLVLVDGEAGIGKSRLVAELVEEVGADVPGPAGVSTDGAAALVLAGSCVALGDTGLPFAPIVEALRGLVGRLDPDELRERLGSSAAELGRLLPGLSDRAESEPSPFQGGDWLQARIFEAVLGLLGRLGERAVVVLVVEDLHWADEATRALLAYLARNLRTERVLIVATIRSDDLDRSHPLLPWLGEMERLPRVERIEIRRFDRAELAGQLRAILGVVPTSALVESILGRSDGNPFFVEELVAAAGEAEGDRAGAPLPATLREVVLVRVGALSPTARLVLQVVAAVGRPVEADLLADVAPLDEADLELGLREAIAAHLLVLEATPSHGRFAFRHTLAREAVEGDLLPTERRRLHLAIATALERWGPAGDGDGPARMAELAYHWTAAGDRARALVATTAAARGAADGYAFAEAGRQYERAIALWPAVPDAETLVGTDLPALMAEASWTAGLAGQAGRALELARDAVAHSAGAVDPVRSAILEERLAWAATEFGDLELATDALGSAVDRLGDGPPSRAGAILLTSLARNLYLRGLDGAIPAAHRAIAAAREVGIPFAEADALVTLAGALRDLGDPDGAVVQLQAGLAIAESIGDAWEIGRAYDHLAGAIGETGDAEGAIAITRDGFDRARQLGVGRAFAPKHVLEQAWRLVNIGRWDEAAAMLDEATGLAPEGIMRRLYCATAGWLASRRGEGRLARGLLDDGRSLGASLRDPRWAAWLEAVTAGLELLEDRPEAARAAVAAGLDGRPRRQEVSILCRVGVEAEADIAIRARARRRPQEVADAATRGAALLDRLRVVATGFGVAGSMATRPLAADLATAEAELDRLAGRSDAGAWAAVAERWMALDQPYEVAWATYRAGEAHLVAGDRRAAVIALRSSRGIADDLGARPLRERVDALARRGRLDLAERTTTRPARRLEPPGEPADPYGLTAREREILALLAEGRTNRQIGEALFISPSTAGVHVSNILAKLDVANRVEAAAIAVRLGLAE